MFDVSFSELMVIGVVALVVIGPERLPRLARTVGHLLGRLQRYVGQVKADINREMQLDDLKKFQDQMSEQARDLQSTFSTATQDLRDVEARLNSPLVDPTTPSLPAPTLADAVPPAPTFEPATVATAETIAPPAGKT